MLEAIADYLIAEGLATAKGTDIFAETMPTDPDTVVVLYEYAGRPPNVPGCETVERKFQVETRSMDPDAAKAKNWSIFNVLHPTEPSKQALTSSRWGLLYAIDTPSKLKEDENGRTIYVCNYSIVTQKG